MEAEEELQVSEIEAKQKKMRREKVGKERQAIGKKPRDKILLSRFIDAKYSHKSQL